MKIKYLGTGAAEGIPALFCHCRVCENARKQKGKEIRTRAQAMIDGEILFDFGPDTYMHFLQNDLDLAAVGLCLVTHTHGDHFFIDDLRMRCGGFAVYEEEIPPLFVYGSSEVEAFFAREENRDITKDGRVVFQKLAPFEERIYKEYTITALPACHGTAEPFFYLVRREDRALLYAHDTDVFQEEVWEYLQGLGRKLQLVSMDCTEGIRPMNYVGHMNLERNFAVRDRMLRMGIGDENTVFAASHFSHNGHISYLQAQNPEIRKGMVIAWDGMELQV